MKKLDRLKSKNAYTCEKMDRLKKTSVKQLCIPHEGAYRKSPVHLSILSKAANREGNKSNELQQTEILKQGQHLLRAPILAARKHETTNPQGTDHENHLPPLPSTRGHTNDPGRAIEPVSMPAMQNSIRG